MTLASLAISVSIVANNISDLLNQLQLMYPYSDAVCTTVMLKKMNTPERFKDSDVIWTNVLQKAINLLVGDMRKLFIDLRLLYRVSYWEKAVGRAH